MNEPEKEYFIGGPCAGSVTSEWTTAGIKGATYRLCKLPGERYVKVHSDYAHDEDWTAALLYGYEQHCKAVAERNEKPVEQPADNILLDGVLLKDFYTASFLRSCQKVIIPSPFGESNPLHLCHGKCYKGYLNEALEFIVYAGMVDGEPEKSMGRIGTPIAIIP